MDELLKFVEMTQEFKAVRRKVVLAKEGREENDAEHSYQLALVAWYIISTQNLKLDLSLVFKYALAHDLVEVYAGDTPSAVLRGYEDERKTKQRREKNALNRLREEFPEFYDLFGLIEGYESHANDESRFVYALDKILPIMNIYLDQGYSWKKHKVALKDIIEYKKDKIALSPDVQKYFEQIMVLLRENQASLFTRIEAE